MNALQNHIFIACAVVLSGYLARNVTISNVTLPSKTIQWTLTTVGGWLTIFSRVDSSWPSSLAQSDYVNGFGNYLTNMWIGLENLYWLTNTAVNGGKSYKLRFELRSSSNEWVSCRWFAAARHHTQRLTYFWWVSFTSTLCWFGVANTEVFELVMNRSEVDQTGVNRWEQLFIRKKNKCVFIKNALKKCIMAQYIFW